MKKRFLAILTSSLFSLCSCINTQAYIKTIFTFDTVFEVGIYKNNNDLLNDVIKQTLEYAKLFNSYEEINGVNNIYSINNSNSPVIVDKKLYDALKIANEYIDKTNGYFNPLIGNLSNAWKHSLENNEILPQNKIEQYLLEMNSSSLIFDDETYSVGISGDATLDLGAFAKGYTLSKIKEYMLNVAKESSYYVDAGSSSVLLGNKPKTNDFNIGLKYIKNAYVKLHDTSIGTSAVYEQLYTIGDTNYSHIVNPFTGSTIPNYDFVMVINEDPTLTDILSTAFMSMSIEEIKAYENNHDIKVIVSNNKDIIYKSSDVEVLYH